MDLAGAARVTIKGLAGLLAAGGLLAGSGLASARGETGAEHLLRFFDGLRALTAEFEQTTRDPAGVVTQRARGELKILRPGRFLWQYTSPYRQLIVTDGATLWVYDPDLEQVTVSRLDNSAGNTPALLLSTDRPLDELFEITGPSEAEGLTWVVLTPRTPDAAFARTRLGFDTGPAGAGMLRVMEIVDGFGQTLRIRLSRVRRNPALDPKVFEFIPPEGVDVVGEAAS